MSDDVELIRWRLILGSEAEAGLGDAGQLSADDLARDRALEWLYELGEEDDGRELVRKGTRGGSGPSSLTVPRWINDVHRLFPRETIERLEREAVEEQGIVEVVTSAEVLQRVEPNETLLRAVLLTKHLMKPDVLAMARALVAKVVAGLLDKLATEVRTAFSGAKSRRSTRRKTGSFDALKTIGKNLTHYDHESRKLLIERAYFFSRTRRRGLRWKLILLVDQSGSMVSSVIHSAVTAACFWGLPSLKTHLVAFDTEVVDLSAGVTDPIELLMRVQLGGGTDIARAARYAESLIENPRRTIVVLISDFFEGGDPDDLVRCVERMCRQGTRVLGLAALDERASPSYDHDLARRLSDKGAHVGAMTPRELVAFVAEAIG
jgi:Mg-chelatase subunit ChlD